MCDKKKNKWSSKLIISIFLVAISVLSGIDLLEISAFKEPIFIIKEFKHDGKTEFLGMGYIISRTYNEAEHKELIEKEELETGFPFGVFPTYDIEYKLAGIKIFKFITYDSRRIP